MKISEAISNMQNIRDGFGDIEVALLHEKSGEFLLDLGLQIGSIELLNEKEDKNICNPVCAIVEQSLVDKPYQPSGLRILK